jgi:hypothetical protein
MRGRAAWQAAAARRYSRIGEGGQRMRVRREWLVMLAILLVAAIVVLVVILPA